MDWRRRPGKRTERDLPFMSMQRELSVHQFSILGHCWPNISYFYSACTSPLAPSAHSVASVWHIPHWECAMWASHCLFSWQSTAVISTHATRDISEVWRGLPGAVAYLTDHFISSFFFGNSEHFFPILSLYLSFTRISKHVLLYLLYFVILSLISDWFYWQSTAG